MATISEMFTTAINEANKSAKAVTDPAQRALAYATIATALATTGAVDNSVKTDSMTTAVAATPEGKESLKNKPAAAIKATPAKAAPAPAKAETPAPVVNAEPELTEEWTEESMELLKEELEFVQTKQVEYGDATMDDLVSSFSDGVHKSISDINPMNIKGFVAFIEQCEADQQSA